MLFRSSLGKIALAYPRAGPHVKDFVLTLDGSDDLTVVDEVTHLLRFLTVVDVEDDEVKQELSSLLWNCEITIIK